MLRPFFSAHKLAPLPRCATITRPPAISGATVGRTDAMYSVREPMKAISLDARAADVARQRDHFGNGRHSPMKARIEAGDLRYAGQSFGHRIDRREIVRLMERRQRYERAQLLEDFRSDDRWAAVLGPAMHDAVPDAEDPGAAIP